MSGDAEDLVQVTYRMSSTYVATLSLSALQSLGAPVDDSDDGLRNWLEKNHHKYGVSDLSAPSPSNWVDSDPFDIDVEEIEPA